MFKVSEISFAASYNRPDCEAIARAAEDCDVSRCFRSPDGRRVQWKRVGVQTDPCDRSKAMLHAECRVEAETRRHETVTDGIHRATYEDLPTLYCRTVKLTNIKDVEWTSELLSPAVLALAETEWRAFEAVEPKYHAQDELPASLPTLTVTKTSSGGLVLERL